MRACNHVFVQTCMHACLLVFEGIMLVSENETPPSMKAGYGPDLTYFILIQTLFFISVQCT